MMMREAHRSWNRLVKRHEDVLGEWRVSYSDVVENNKRSHHITDCYMNTERRG